MSRYDQAIIPVFGSGFLCDRGTTLCAERAARKQYGVTD